MSDKPEFKEIISADYAHFRCSRCDASFRFPVNTTLGAIERERDQHKCENIAFIGRALTGDKPDESKSDRC